MTTSQDTTAKNIPEKNAASVAGVAPAPNEAPATTGSESEARPAAAEAKAADMRADHGPDGRFQKGNRGGPGNPFARVSARQRKVAQESVSDDDIREIMAAMKVKAKNGSESAAKFVMSYSAGKPNKAADPDTLDQHEAKIFIDNHKIAPDDILRVIQALPVDLLLEMLRVVVPALFNDKWKMAQEVFTAPAEADEEEEDEEDSEVEVAAPAVQVPQWMLDIVEKDKSAEPAASKPAAAKPRCTPGQEEKLLAAVEELRKVLPPEIFMPQDALPDAEEARRLTEWLALLGGRAGELNRMLSPIQTENHSNGNGKK